MSLFSKLFASTLKNPDEKTFELWLEGDPPRMRRAEKIATIKGTDFNVAIRNFLDKMQHPVVTMWRFDHVASQWRFHDRKAFDNEKDARVKFG
ncbi:MAG TPA: hypothetical protein VF905_12995 [Nitrospirota bacterium]